MPNQRGDPNRQRQAYAGQRTNPRLRSQQYQFKFKRRFFRTELPVLTHLPTAA